MMKRSWSAAAVAALATSVLVAGASVPASAEESSTAGAPTATAATCAADPLYFAYYRTWRDVNATWPGSENEPPNYQRMDDLPHGVDVAFVFNDYVSDDSAFWDVLVDEYVPNLHAQGTKLVRTIDIGVILNTPTADTPAAYDAAADAILAEYVDGHGLDGLDVDMERSLTVDQVARAKGVFQALSEHIGPQSGTDKLFIYDTNQPGTHPLTSQIAPYVSYVLVQSYGRSVTGLQATWDQYAPYFDACQYLIGFSFYEERGANWNDTNNPFETSRAAQYANWQPAGETKGGIFSYAVDRDGKVYGDDTITASDFSWSTRLIGMQDAAAGAVSAPPSAPAATLGADRRTVSGTGTANTTINVTVTGSGALPSAATTTVGSDRTWSVTLDRKLSPAMTASVTQSWWNTAASAATTVKVKK